MHGWPASRWCVSLLVRIAEGDGGAGRTGDFGGLRKIKSASVQADEKPVCYWSSGVGERELLFTAPGVENVIKKLEMELSGCLCGKKFSFRSSPQAGSDELMRLGMEERFFAKNSTPPKAVVCCVERFKSRALPQIV
ncbi:hypothetical protein TNCV_2566221, partial [Trichonephila clavipes]